MFLTLEIMEQLCILSPRPQHTSVFQYSLQHPRRVANNQKHLGKNLAVELGPRNITTNVVAPGFFPSKLAAGLIDRLGGTTELEEANPRKRLGEPEDIAGVMVFLCSPAGSYMYEFHVFLYYFYSLLTGIEMVLISVWMEE